MMARDDVLFYLGAGPIAAVGLGVALIPLREATTASNLAFAFLALTIVVGHAGGRWPATATAVASALSLNFFLTRPYLTLTIHGRDDVAAFLGLAACGLISAALGSVSGERLAKRRQLEVLYSAARDLELSGPATSRVQRLLESACAAFPVAALALRDESGRLIASAGDRTRLAVVPQLTADDDLGADASALPVRPRRPPHCRARECACLSSSGTVRSAAWISGATAGPPAWKRGARFEPSPAPSRPWSPPTATRSRQPTTRSEAAPPGSPFPAAPPGSSLQYRRWVRPARIPRLSSGGSSMTTNGAGAGA